MACKRCGHCCVMLTVRHDGLEKVQDPLGIRQYFEAHHCQIVKKTSKEDGREFQAIRIPLLCKHLQMKDGVAWCGIYDRRPKICRDYLCKRAKDN